MSSKPATRSMKDVALSIWIVLFTVLVLYTVISSRVENSNRIDDLAANKDALVFAGCREQNTRSIKTHTRLNERFTLIAADPNLTQKQKNDLARSKEFTVSLINALAPYRKCKKLVQDRNKLPNLPADITTDPVTPKTTTGETK